MFTLLNLNMRYKSRLSTKIKQRSHFQNMNSYKDAVIIKVIYVQILIMKNYRDRIRISPNIRSGKPCIVNTRIAVSDVFDYLGGGMSVEEVLDDFPDLTLADIQACFAFAADRDRRLTVVPYEVAV
jgi:uncharacterized protein (DUF433 family)